MTEEKHEMMKISNHGKKKKLPSYKIELEDVEEKLFSLLVRAADWYHHDKHDSITDTSDGESNASSSNESESNRMSISGSSLIEAPTTKLELRVAGGWVRDKILGLHSHDVDIAVDKMSGVEFCEVVLQYLEYLEETNQSVEDLHHKMSVINANPEQSKHLETATMKVLGIDVDFVNLRAEELYLPNSRIPHSTTKFGTPLEDALRRDLTINALFYNLRTREVEDYTNRGLEDLLVKKLVETPLDPLATFHDDPLRVLRAVKFAVRFDFDIALDLRNAALSPDVHQSLLLKVSRERVGKELSAMLIGKNANPIQALTLLSTLGLAQPVFGLPSDTLLTGCILNTRYEDIPDPVLTVSSHDNLFDQAWSHASFLISHLSLFKEVPNVDTTMIHLSTFLHPFSNLSYKDRKKKEILLIIWMFREGLKFKNKDVASLQIIYDNLGDMRRYLNSDTPTRLQLGLLLRQLKNSWLITLMLATIVEIHYPFFDYIQSKDAMQNQQELLQSYANSTLYQQTKDKYISIYQTIYKLITSTYDLDKCWTIHPLINGKELFSLLHIQKGPVVGTYLEEQMKWMLQYPDGSKEDCLDFLKELRERRNLEGLDDVCMRSVEKKKKRR